MAKLIQSFELIILHSMRKLNADVFKGRLKW